MKENLTLKTRRKMLQNLEGIVDLKNRQLVEKLKILSSWVLTSLVDLKSSKVYSQLTAQIWVK